MLRLLKFVCLFLVVGFLFSGCSKINFNNITYHEVVFPDSVSNDKSSFELSASDVIEVDGSNIIYFYSVVQGVESLKYVLIDDFLFYVDSKNPHFTIIVDNIKSREFRDGVWYYKLSVSGKVVKSKNKYYYLGSFVQIEVDNCDEIQSITKIYEK